METSRAIFSSQDLRQIKQRGMTPDGVSLQIERFKKGMPFARLIRACRTGDGIRILSGDDLERLGRIYERAASAGRATKFVPASGAATRMFQSLERVHNQPERYLDGDTVSGDSENEEERDLLTFVNALRRFAFYDDLESVMHKNGLDILAAIRNKDYRAILAYLLPEEGLNLANLPKGLIKFHAYPEGPRTAFEEHLAEAAGYVRDNRGRTRIHFTVSPQHESSVKDFFKKVLSRYERSGTRFDISFSTQRPSTDTIAVDLQDRPFRTHSGRLLFRPGGHGALLENLSDLEADIVFIKNIDNVVPDKAKGDIIVYERALGGLLIELQDRIFRYLQMLMNKERGRSLMREVEEFAAEELSIACPQCSGKDPTDALAAFYMAKLNRPLRVCGMVRNVGEPGGGPFWVVQENREVSLQIVESSQVDMTSGPQRAIWESATHFNPVDMVCAVRNAFGRPFRLTDYVDPETGFIATKSMQGRKLKALERPGLWNGGMADWSTVFVEVPNTSFNPVKTVLDLLRKEHQPDSAGP